MTNRSSTHVGATVTLPDGSKVPALGQGTWYMGDEAAARSQEIAALRRGMDLGMTLIDTAEMYGDGRAERLVGEALAGCRDEAFLVSKVYPHNASRQGMVAACERSLKRLGTDRLDLYLLHWRGDVPLAETIEAFEALKAAGKILRWGVSNFDLADMRELWNLPGGKAVAVNQLLYNLSRRGIEWDLRPWLSENHVPVMAYSPIEQARLLRHNGLAAFSKGLDITPAQAALAWLLAKPGVIAIPKSGRRERVEENHGALSVKLEVAQLAELDRMFAPPTGPKPLEML